MPIAFNSFTYSNLISLAVLRPSQQVAAGKSILSVSIYSYNFFYFRNLFFKKALHSHF